MSSMRTLIYVLGAVAAVSLALLIIPAVGLTGDPERGSTASGLGPGGRSLQPARARIAQKVAT